MEKILRECNTCGFAALSEDQLLLFVADKGKPNNYCTKAMCKPCNAKINKEKRKGTYIYPDKSTRCKDCDLKPKNSKELEILFVKDKGMRVGYANLCKKCASLRTIKHQKSNPEMFKKRKRKYSISQYGITVEQYDEILRIQEYSCAICKTSQNKFNKNLNVDHDHLCCPEKKSCGRCVRGLLCPSCNLMIGLSKDNKQTLEYAIIYLSRGESN